MMIAAIMALVGLAIMVVGVTIGSSSLSLGMQETGARITIIGILVMLVSLVL